MMNLVEILPVIDLIEISSWNIFFSLVNRDMNGILKIMIDY